MYADLAKTINSVVKPYNTGENLFVMALLFEVCSSLPEYLILRIDGTPFLFFPY